MRVARQELVPRCRLLSGIAITLATLPTLVALHHTRGKEMKRVNFSQIQLFSIFQVPEFEFEFEQSGRE